MKKYYENLEVNVDAIYKAICNLDKEYEGKSSSKKTPSSYFAYEAVDKTSELDRKMVLLPYADKERLASLIDGRILSSKDRRTTSVMQAFYDAVHYYVPITISSFKPKTYKR